MLDFVPEVVLRNVLVDIEPLGVVVNQLKLVDVLGKCLQESIKIVALPVLPLLAPEDVLVGAGTVSGLLWCVDELFLVPAEALGVEAEVIFLIHQLRFATLV